MARKPKNIRPGDPVHTIFRTNERTFLFTCAHDHQLFLKALRRQRDRYNVNHFAWTGMSNHHHVFNEAPLQWHEHTNFARLQKQKNVPIPCDAMVRDTQAFFAKSFNLTHGRFGCLISDRTKTIKVYGQFHALTLLIYIFLNPVRAGIVCRPEDYAFSNFNQYAYGVKCFDDLFVPHPAYLALGKCPFERQEKFRILVAQATKSWALKRWPGASGNHCPGFQSEKKAFDEFLELSQNWLCDGPLETQGSSIAL